MIRCGQQPLLLLVRLFLFPIAAIVVVAQPRRGNVRLFFVVFSLLSLHKNTHTHTHVCVCVCVGSFCFFWQDTMDFFLPVVVSLFSIIFVDSCRIQQDSSITKQHTMFGLPDPSRPRGCGQPRFWQR